MHLLWGRGPALGAGCRDCRTVFEVHCGLRQRSAVQGGLQQSQIQRAGCQFHVRTQSGSPAHSMAITGNLQHTFLPQMLAVYFTAPVLSCAEDGLACQQAMSLSGDCSTANFLELSSKGCKIYLHAPSRRCTRLRDIPVHRCKASLQITGNMEVLGEGRSFCAHLSLQRGKAGGVAMHAVTQTRF